MARGNGGASGIGGGRIEGAGGGAGGGGDLARFRVASRRGEGHGSVRFDRRGRRQAFGVTDRRGFAVDLGERGWTTAALAAGSAILAPGAGFLALAFAEQRKQPRLAGPVETLAGEDRAPGVELTLRRLGQARERGGIALAALAIACFCGFRKALSQFRIEFPSLRRRSGGLGQSFGSFGIKTCQARRGLGKRTGCLNGNL